MEDNEKLEELYKQNEELMKSNSELKKSIDELREQYEKAFDREREKDKNTVDEFDEVCKKIIQGV